MISAARLQDAPRFSILDKVMESTHDFQFPEWLKNYPSPKTQKHLRERAASGQEICVLTPTPIQVAKHYDDRGYQPVHIAEIRRNSKAEAESFLAGLEYCDDSSNSSIGIRRDPDRPGKWLAVVVNFDARSENDLDEELSASESHPVEFYLEKYRDTERFDPSF